VAMLRVEDVRKSFGPVEVLRGISLTVGQGDVVALVGRSGSGKSTLLRCLNGLEVTDGGRIEIAGHTMSYEAQKLRELRKDVGIVFQSFNLFPHMTVLENIVLAPCVAKGISKQEAQSIARDMLAKVGLSDRSDAYPEQLSGGQQQRVAIARSLAMKPKVMLFDEVTSALDPELTGEVLVVLEKLASDGMTMLLVTHEMAFAKSVATTTIFMHEGRIHESGESQEMFTRPKTKEFKQFVGQPLH